MRRYKDTKTPSLLDDDPSGRGSGWNSRTTASPKEFDKTLASRAGLSPVEFVKERQRKAERAGRRMEAWRRLRRMRGGVVSHG